MARNLYKILPIEDVNDAWFAITPSGQSLEDAVKSVDGKLVLLKIPEGIQGVEDVPEEWLSDYVLNAPYLTHAEMEAIIRTPEWGYPTLEEEEAEG